MLSSFQDTMSLYSKCLLLKIDMFILSWFNKATKTNGVLIKEIYISFKLKLIQILSLFIISLSNP